MSDELVLPGGRRLDVFDGLVIGRNPAADLQLPDESVSRDHARVTGKLGHWIVQDLHSRNGTWVNATRLHTGGAHPVRDGDVIRVGRLLLKVLLEEPTSHDTTTGLDRHIIARRLLLSPYQLAVLRCLCSTEDPEEPPSNAEIARQLNTPEAVDAVKAAFSRIYARAGLSAQQPGKRRELRRRAVQEGWLT